MFEGAPVLLLLLFSKINNTKQQYFNFAIQSKCAYYVVIPVIIPHACARGKAIGFVCCLSSVVVMKITRSRVLGICVCCNYHKLVDISEKLVPVCFELLNMARAH